LAATVRVAGDIDVAEECVQDAFSRALTVWPITGTPRNTGAWLTTVARRRAIDVLRRESAQGRALVRNVEPEESAIVNDVDLPGVPDDRLRLIFTCCHPALSMESQVALTLKLLCGLSTAEVARSFLVSESTMAARITRAKKKIKTSHIPFRLPETVDLPARVDAVLLVVHLLFTTGHTAPLGSDLMNRDLVDRSLDLARILRALLPDDSEVAGLLALILLTDARHETRLGDDGTMLLLSEQDRSRWDRSAIDEGSGLVRDALAHRAAGPFVLMAAIAALHAESPSWESTEWREIVELYDRLFAIWPSPVVALNRAVAIGLADGTQRTDGVDHRSPTIELRLLGECASRFSSPLGTRWRSPHGLPRSHRKL
jgi:RNA polymerase sigma-70 factor (ECF subfamily)